MLPAVGQSSAPTFPPPLWGRDRERGRTRTASVSCCSQVCASDEPHVQCFVATPLPVPLPQGGREPWGTNIRNSRTVFADRLPCVHALSASAGTPTSQSEHVEHRGVALLLEFRRVLEPRLAGAARP